MAKKRRREDSAESSAPVKREKFQEFNGTVFKSMLKEPTQAMKGLEKFITTAKKLPCPELYDVVEGYIKISMECTEIFQLLEREKQVENELILIVESLEMILLRTASDLSHFNTVGNAIVKKTVQSHMKNLLGSLHSNNHRFVRHCLSFLSALVAQGPEAAREVLGLINGYKALSALAKRRDKQGKPDVRMAFIQFVLSFLVSGDNAIIGQILEIKEFLPEILNTGLKEDRLSIVNLILSSLKSRVVLNKAISKTQKVRFFTPSVLANLASLYKWNGIVDAATDKETEEEDSQQDGVSVVRGLVHSFLLDLCCSRKHGIIFHDAYFGTVGRAGNIVLLQFLVGLKQASEDELVADLVVKVLKASPDILSRYLKETQHSYSPRVKSSWHNHVKLLKKIYEAQPEISTIFQSSDVIPSPRLLNMINVLSLPPVCNKAFFTQGLCLANSSVQVTTLSTLNFVLQRAHRNMEFLLEMAQASSPDGFSADMVEKLVQQYRETLSKILPDMTTIVGKWQSLSKKEKAETDATKTSNEESCDTNGKDTQVSETAEMILLKALILQVICLYQKVVPHLVGQCKFDFSKLLKGIISEKGLKEEVPPVLQYHILRLALELPSSKFSWFRLQDAAHSESFSSERSVLFQILNMFVSSSTSHLKTSTRMLLLKVLKESGVFEYTWTELELWLDQLNALKPGQREPVIHFLDKVWVKLVSSSHVYSDKVASLVQEAAYVQANLSGQDADVTSIPVSHIDDALEVLDVIMESNEGEMEEFGPPLSEDFIIQSFPFSALVPAALDARNKLPEDKDVVLKYLSAVLTQLLHCQRDPLPLCMALLHYDKELVSESSSHHQSVIHLYQYYSRWLPPQYDSELATFKAIEIQSENLSSPATFTSLMKEAYMQGPDALSKDDITQTLNMTLVSMSLTEFPITIKQTLLYIKTTVENFGTFTKDSGNAVLKNLMKILQDLVTKLLDFKETTSSGPCENISQEGSDLFLEVNQLHEVGSSKEQVLISSLSSILKHPCLQQWFLALELGALPPHSLKLKRLQQLCSLMTDNILTILTTIAHTLSIINHLDLLNTYTKVIINAVLKELTEINTQSAKRQYRPIQALLSLYNYMDFSDVKEVVSKLLLLPQDILFCNGGPQLSVYGHAALQILTQSSSFECVFLSQAHLHSLGTLLLSCSSPELESFLLQTLSSEPGSAKLIKSEVLLHCIRQQRSESQRIACLLLQNSSTHRLCFEVWCLQEGNVKKLAEEMETFLPLIKTYLQLATKEDLARPKDVQDDVLKTLKQALLPKWTQCVLKDSGAEVAEALSCLIRLSADSGDIKELTSTLPSALHKTDSFERWQVVDVITEKLSESPEELNTWRKAMISAALVHLKGSYTQCIKDPEMFQSVQEQSILDMLRRLTISAEDIPASEWNSFVKTGLKYRYKHAPFLTCLISLIEVMYRENAAPTDLLPLATLHMMSSSHSLFLPSMLNCSQEQAELQAKEALVSLLLCLVKMLPSVCNINHFVVLLGAYGASLSILDQKLLLLLQEYEENCVSLLKFQSFLWGPAAVEHHKAKKSLGESLWKQTSTDELLALLQTDRIIRTISHFPQQRTLILQDDKEPLFQTNDRKDLQSLYDPRFLLPLFSAILCPESVVDCLKFVSSHALGLTLMALSSYDPKMRAAAYHVLTCFSQHLEGARFREKKQLLYLMDIVKNGVRQRNQRLPFVLTTYISKVAQLMLKPEDHMYIVLNKFLLSHQCLDFRRVPEFFRLFYGFDLEHTSEREWILTVLEEGLSDRYCYELCEQQGIFQSLLGFCSSPLCDDNSQAQIIRVLCNAVKVTQAAYNLPNSCGLLSWILQLLEKRKLDQHLLGATIKLLYELWVTNLGQKEKQLDEVRSFSSTEDKPVKPVKCLPLPLICEFIHVASTIIKHLRLGVKACHWSIFVQTYSSLLRHYVAALEMKRQTDSFTVLSEPLSCTEALSLLKCWASLNYNTHLLSYINTLAEKHALKQLSVTYNDKACGRGSRSEKVNLPEETVEETEEDQLKESQLFLCAIFCHWTPLSVTQSRTSQLGDKLKSSQLAKDSALLFTKWSLRTLLESPYSQHRTTDFLHWLESAVIVQQEIVDVLLLDIGLKADLLRLYHQAFETECNVTISGRTYTKRLFTKIMIGLLESQGHLPEMHRAIVTSCMPENASDQSRHAIAGVCLSSLYVHEVWTGVPSAELFMSHVRMVTEGKSKASAESAVRDICNDIITKSKYSSQHFGSETFLL